MSYVENRYPQLAERLFRALGLRGPLSSLVTWESQVGINLADLTRPEYAWLMRETRYVGSAQQAAVAAQNSIITFANTGRNLITIDRLQVENRNAGSITVGINTDVAAFGAASARVMGLDTRQDVSTSPVPRPTLAAAAGSQVLALPATSPAWNMSSSEVRDLLTPDTPLVLKPGTVLWVQVSAVNLQLDVKLWWRERAPSDSELS